MENLTEKELKIFRDNVQSYLEYFVDIVNNSNCSTGLKSFVRCDVGMINDDFITKGYKITRIEYPGTENPIKEIRLDLIEYLNGMNYQLYQYIGKTYNFTEFVRMRNYERFKAADLYEIEHEKMKEAAYAEFRNSPDFLDLDSTDESENEHHYY